MEMTPHYYVLLVLSTLPQLYKTLYENRKYIAKYQNTVHNKYSKYMCIAIKGKGSIRTFADDINEKKYRQVASITANSGFYFTAYFQFQDSEHLILCLI